MLVGWGGEYNSGEYDKTVVFISVMEMVLTCFWYQLESLFYWLQAVCYPLVYTNTFFKVRHLHVVIVMDVKRVKVANYLAIG